MSGKSCTTKELASVDDDLAVCDKSKICPSTCTCTSKSAHIISSELESESSDEESVDLELLSAQFSNIAEAIFDDVHLFLELKGHTCEATQAMSLIE